MQTWHATHSDFEIFFFAVVASLTQPEKYLTLSARLQQINKITKRIEKKNKYFEK